MASPTVRQTARTAQLAQNLFDSGSDTSISITVASDNNWNDEAGVAKIGTGSSSEWVSFTGVTTVSATKQTLTGCVRGLDKDATSLSDATSSNKKTNSIGASVKLVHHSVEINKLIQKDADETVTGSVAFSNSTRTPFVLPTYTEAERDALTTNTNGALILESDNGYIQARIGGNWNTLDMSTPTSFMTDSAAGTGQLATSAEKQALTGTDSVTGAPLLIRNDDTERTLHPSNTNTTDTMVIGGGSTGDRATSFSLDGSDSNDGFVISRASGANGATTITSNGTGDVDFVTGTGADITFTPGSGGNVVIDGPVTFGTSGGYVAEAFTAGETLAAGDWVYYKSSDGKAWKATKTSIATATILGVVITGGAADATVYIQTSGVYTTTGLTADTNYYLSTGGALTATKPDIDSGSIVPVLVGRAVSTTKLQIINRRLQRVLNAYSSFASITSASTTSTVTVGFPISHGEFNYNYAGGAYQYYANGSFHLEGGGQYTNFIQVANAVQNNINYGSACLALQDTTDLTGYMYGVASENGSNNLVITWTQSGTFSDTLTVNYILKLYEAL